MIRTAQIEVEDTPVLVAAGDVDGQFAELLNAGEETVFLGDLEVSDETGFGLPKDGTLTVELGGAEALWGVCAEGKEATVHVLRTGAR